MANQALRDQHDTLQKQQPGQHAQPLSSFVWSIAEILRGDFKQSEYGEFSATVRDTAEKILIGSKA
jgi:hypothetical protein